VGIRSCHGNHSLTEDAMEFLAFLIVVWVLGYFGSERAKSEK
jgi:hypothetical protein